MSAEDESGLQYARAWLRREPGPDAWANLAAVHATKQPRNLKRARYWYRRAALGGHHRGLFEYGLMLIDGEGGPKCSARGRHYLERAAAVGQIDAMKVLAHGLSSGGYSYRPNARRAVKAKRALRRALARLRKDNAG
jgi:TPR repeat protein